MLNNVKYLSVSKEGLLIQHAGKQVLLGVDNVVICAGQVSELKLADELDWMGVPHHPKCASASLAVYIRTPGAIIGPVDSLVR
jgi:hypothetical protein